MIKSLKLINSIEKSKDIPANEKWLKYLFCTTQKNVNLNNVDDISHISRRTTLNYVKRTLEILDSESSNYDSKDVKIVEEVLEWCEVAKTGSYKDRESWKKKRYDLATHNEASAFIYKDNVKAPNDLIFTLIKTHGLIGQYTQGE